MQELSRLYMHILTISNAKFSLQEMTEVKYIFSARDIQL